MVLKQRKHKKCQICKADFMPRNSLHVVCSGDCAIEKLRRTEERKQRQAKQAERKAIRAKKEALKTLGQHKKELQVIFNRYIRLRDADLPCISCGTTKPVQYHAGHYRSVGANPELRFNEDNCNKQCAACNNHKSGNLIDYRINLTRKIGIDKVEKLEGPQAPQHFTVQQIKDMKSEYRARCKALEKEQHNAA